MNDLADQGFHEIQLSGKQLVFLFMATTVVAVLIFLCGVKVGRGVGPERGIETADTVAAAVTSAASIPRSGLTPRPTCTPQRKINTARTVVAMNRKTSCFPLS